MDDMTGLLFVAKTFKQRCKETFRRFSQASKVKAHQQCGHVICQDLGLDAVPNTHVTFPVQLAIKANLGTALALTTSADGLDEREYQGFYSLVYIFILDDGNKWLFV